MAHYAAVTTAIATAMEPPRAGHHQPDLQPGALQLMIETLIRAGHDDADRFTCDDAMSVALGLDALGHLDDAVTWLWMHAAGDGDSLDFHYGLRTRDQARALLVWARYSCGRGAHWTSAHRLCLMCGRELPPAPRRGPAPG